MQIKEMTPGTPFVLSTVYYPDDIHPIYVKGRGDHDVYQLKNGRLGPKVETRLQEGYENGDMCGYPLSGLQIFEIPAEEPASAKPGSAGAGGGG